jgi:hypothetical protein
MRSLRFTYGLAILVALAAGLPGLLRMRLDAAVIETALAGEASAKAETARVRAEAAEPFERGVFVFCRMVGEGMFGVSMETAVKDCNAFLVTAREKGLQEFRYWQLGYETVD